MQYPSKIVCVGMNYRLHAQELGSALPSSPVFFMKPVSCMVPMHGDVAIVQDLGEVHHELELYLTIGKTIARNAAVDAQHLHTVISHIGLAYDLTLRDVQKALKQHNHPWEKAKCFEGACPIAAPIPYDHTIPFNNLHLRLYKNGHVQQEGHTADMIFDVATLLQHITKYCTLQQGDIVLTGTPAGVSALQPSDALRAELWHAHTLLAAVDSTIVAA